MAEDQHFLTPWSFHLNWWCLNSSTTTYPRVPILSNIEPKQIKVCFQDRRCREKQRKEAYRRQQVNRKLTSMNEMLMEENDRLQKQVSNMVYENSYFRQHTHNVTRVNKDTSSESVVARGQHQLTPQPPPRDVSPARISIKGYRNRC